MRTRERGVPSVSAEISMSVFNPKIKNVNKTSTEAGLAPGSCTVEYKQLTMCTVLFSLAQPENEKKAQALPELSSRFHDFFYNSICVSPHHL